MTSGLRLVRVLAMPAVVLVFAAAVSSGQVLERDISWGRSIAVPAEQGWVDTGLDVNRGEILYFRAAGEITLQRGNPAAACGPDGMEIVSSGQPMPGRNTGSLIGKVVQLIGIRKDEETGEEIRDEIVEMFYIGPESRVSIPLNGRLFLGINENVFADNGGRFTVDIFNLSRRAGP